MIKCSHRAVIRKITAKKIGFNRENPKLFLKGEKIMKKRRTLIIALLLVAALCLGIGYAAQSGYVEVSGNVSNTPHPVKLVFVENGSSLKDSKVTVVNNSERVASTNNELIVVDNTSTATFDISDLSHQDDYAILYLRVKNTNEYDVALESDPDKAGNLVITKNANADGTTPDDFFTVEAEWITEDGDVENLTLAEGETKTLKVTIKMIDSTGDNVSGSYKLQVWGTSAS